MLIRGTGSVFKRNLFCQISVRYRVVVDLRVDTVVCHYSLNWGELVTDIEIRL